jgi:hypothetical protein
MSFVIKKNIIIKYLLLKFIMLNSGAIVSRRLSISM